MTSAAEAAIAETLIDKLGSALDRWHDKFEPRELDEISHIIFALEEIQEGNR